MFKVVSFSPSNALATFCRTRTVCILLLKSENLLFHQRDTPHVSNPWLNSLIGKNLALMLVLSIPTWVHRVILPQSINSLFWKLINAIKFNPDWIKNNWIKKQEIKRHKIYVVWSRNWSASTGGAFIILNQNTMKNYRSQSTSQIHFLSFIWITKTILEYERYSITSCFSSSGWVISQISRLFFPTDSICLYVKPLPEIYPSNGYMPMSS